MPALTPASAPGRRFCCRHASTCREASFACLSTVELTIVLLGRLLSRRFGGGVNAGLGAWRMVLLQVCTGLPEKCRGRSLEDRPLHILLLKSAPAVHLLDELGSTSITKQREVQGGGRKPSSPTLTAIKTHSFIYEDIYRGRAPPPTARWRCFCAAPGLLKGDALE